MNFRKQFRSPTASQRRRNLQQHLRLEHLEHRIVFAGLSPVAVNDLYQAVADETLTVATSGVLANDSDAESDALTALEFSGPSNGSLALNADGSFAYTPNPGFTGTDGFIYQADDGASRSRLAIVTIQVANPNTAPRGQGDAYTVPEDGVLGIGSTHGLLANDSDVDGDPLQAILVEGPQHGTLELNADGSFIYTPNVNYNGPDAFTYEVSDGTQSSELVAVDITVDPANDAPQGNNEAYTTAEDQ
ncbi:MAG: tandem-95 repeat protein, partial [Planctomycetales bacterium]|nr:tandem-95 repeat protein [Planctomycetales bacterium]